MRQPVGKRALDVSVSLVALLLLAPLLGLLALWVRLDSPGPALFRQTRLGLRGVPFELYKFRSMVVRESVEQYREAVVEEGRDPRITRAGRWLRVTSLDELPQLWNVLRGDMSLVGPRPLLPEQEAAVPVRLSRRFMVLPGLTGLAQVRGRRGLDWPEQLAADCDYVDAQSLWRDLLILLATVRVVFAAQGVYGGAGSNWRAYLPVEQTRQEEEARET
ncbi:sugar transferase [Halomonas sp. 11-S5]|uniref:sugar transferase n=1 Tax=Halomonas sp. 11-S5 TaxID=2994064 RepID=UPI00246911AA|nr:sugar transferase [Halomonas sp. 11-S5]